MTCDIDILKDSLTKIVDDDSINLSSLFKIVDAIAESKDITADIDFESKVVESLKSKLLDHANAKKSNPEYKVDGLVDILTTHKNSGSILDMVVNGKNKKDRKISFSTIIIDAIEDPTVLKGIMSKSAYDMFTNIKNGSPNIVKDKLEIASKWFESTHIKKEQDMAPNMFSGEIKVGVYSIEDIKNTDGTVTKTLALKDKDGNKLITSADKDRIVKDISRLVNPSITPQIIAEYVEYISGKKVPEEYTGLIEAIGSKVPKTYFKRKLLDNTIDESYKKELVGLLLDAESTSVSMNPLITLGTDFKYNGKFTLLPEVEEAIRLESLSTMASLMELTNRDGRELERFMKNTFQLKEGDSLYEEIVYMVKVDHIVPTSLVSRSAGESIFRQLGVGFTDNVDINLKPDIISALGMMSVEAVKGTSYNKSQDIKTPLTIYQHWEDGSFVKTLEKTPKSTAVLTTSMMQLPMNNKVISDTIRASDLIDFMKEESETSLVSTEPPEDKVYGLAVTRHGTELIPKDAVDYINKEQRTSHRFTDDFHTLYNIMFGIHEKSGKDINEIAYDLMLESNEDLATKDSISIERAVAKRNADKLDIDRMLMIYNAVAEQSFYHNWDFTKSGRFMIDSKMINAQNSKISRFLTESFNDEKSMSYDMEKVKGEFKQAEIDMLQMGIAQALDMDPDKIADPVMIKTLNEEVIKINVDGTIEYRDTVEGNELKEAVDKFSKGEMFDVSSHPVSHRMHVFQAISTLANIAKSNEGGKGSNTVHNSVNVEVDAITSGMMQLLLQMGTTWAMNLVKKGGVYSKKEDGTFEYKSHAEFRQDMNIEKGTGLDFYATPAEQMYKDLDAVAKARVYKSKQKNPSENKGLALVQELKEEGVDLSKVPVEYSPIEQLILTYLIAGKTNKWRSILKPLVMVYIYGASITSIKTKAGFTLGINSAAGPGVLVKAMQSFKNEDGSPMTVVQVFQKAFPEFDKGTAENTWSYPKNMSDKGKIEIDGMREILILLSQTMDNRNVNLVNTDWNTKEQTKLYISSRLIKDFTESFQVSNFNKETGELSKTHFPKGRVTEDNVSLEKRTPLEIPFKDLVIAPKMIEKIANKFSQAFGELLENSFSKSFSGLDDFRTSLKAVELVNYSVFKYKFTKAMEPYRDSETGIYKINKHQHDKILSKLGVEGFSYSYDNPISGQHSYTSTEKESIGTVAVTGTMLDGRNEITKVGNSYQNAYVPNVGATGVITIHTIDGHLMQVSNVLGQNIFDAWILSSNPQTVVGASEVMNKNTSELSRKHNILDKAMVKADASLKKFSDEDMVDFIGFMQSSSEAELLTSAVNRITKGDIKTTLIDMVASMKDEVDGHNANMSKSTLTNHYFFTDTGGSYQSKELIGKDKLDPKNIVQLQLPLENIQKVLGIIQDNVIAEEPLRRQAEADAMKAVSTILGDKTVSKEVKDKIIKTLKDKGCI